MTELEQVKTLFIDHARDDREQFASIHTKLDLFSSNHLPHIQETMTAIAEDMKDVKTGLAVNTKDTAEARVNIGWIMKIGGVVGSAIVVGLVGLFFRGL